MPKETGMITTGSRDQPLFGAIFQ